MQRYDPQEIASEYAKQNIIPSFNYFYHQRPNGQIEACTMGMWHILHSPEMYAEYLKEPWRNSKGFGLMKEVTGSEAYCWGLTMAFQPYTPDRIRSIMQHMQAALNGRKGAGHLAKKFDAYDMDELQAGVNDAREVAKLCGVQVHRENVVKEIKVYIATTITE